MEKKSKHPNHVINYNGTLDELARAIGNMTYDQVALFIEKLAMDIKSQSDADLNRGRKKLSQSLDNASSHLNQAKEEMNLVWGICKPYMPKNKKASVD